MKSIFINENEKVEVMIYLIEDNNGEILASNNKKGLLSQKNIVKDTFQEHTITFKLPNYGDSADIYKDSFKLENGDLKVDPSSLRINKFVNLLKKWTFVDENNKPIPANKKNIMKLHSSLANLILNEFEKLTDDS